MNRKLELFVAYFVRPVRRAVVNMIARGKATYVKDSEGLQVMQVYFADGDLHDEVGRLQDYGFTSVPLAGAQVLILSVGASRSHLVVARADHPKDRPLGLPGESIMYTKFGHRVHQKANGDIDLLAPSGMVNIIGNLNVTGNLTAAGHVSDAAGNLAAIRAAYNSHVHKENDNGSSPFTDSTLQRME